MQNKVLNTWITFLLGSLIFHFFFRGNDFLYTMWADRDLSRTLNMLSPFQSTGAELTGEFGARVPGGAQYYLMKVPLLFTKNPLISYYWMLFLNLLVTVVIFYYIIKRYFGKFVALSACFLLIIGDSAGEGLDQLWNPGFSFFLSY